MMRKEISCNEDLHANHSINSQFHIVLLCFNKGTFCITSRGKRRMSVNDRWPGQDGAVHFLSVAFKRTGCNSKPRRHHWISQRPSRFSIDFCTLSRSHLVQSHAADEIQGNTRHGKVVDDDGYGVAGDFTNLIWFSEVRSALTNAGDGW